MGRCYDFGVSIDPTSELAMVVAPEGGHCVCPTTGVTCQGRFEECAPILAAPGRVSQNAPAWALSTSAVDVMSPEPTRIGIQAPAGQLHGALAAAESRAVPSTDQVLSDLHAALDALRGDIARLRDTAEPNDTAEPSDSPRTATVEDLADAVVVLRHQMQNNDADTESTTRAITESVTAAVTESVTASVTTAITESVTAAVVESVTASVTAAITESVNERINGLAGELEALGDLPTTVRALSDTMIDTSAAVAAVKTDLGNQIEQMSGLIGEQFTETVSSSVTTAITESMTTTTESVNQHVDELARDVEALGDLPTAVRALGETMVDTSAAVATAKSELGSRIEQMSGLIGEQFTETVATRLGELLDAQKPQDLTSIETPINKLGRGVVALRDLQNRTLDELRRIESTTSAQLDLLRDELGEQVNRQTRELHTLRRLLSEIQVRDEQREAEDVSGRELADRLDRMQTDLARLSPESPGMLTATQLADTINTLRDAGVEDISAAHLVHALQRDIREIRDEMHSIRDAGLGSRDELTLDLSRQAG